MTKKTKVELKQEETRNRILSFYKAKQNQELILRAGRMDSELWEGIFLWVYGSMPDATIPQPANFKRPGIKDPRWDELFGQRAAFKAQDWAIEEVVSSVKVTSQEPVREDELSINLPVPLYGT